MHASPMRALSPCGNESVSVSWHNINYPIKIEWVINCPSLPALITLVERGHLRGAKTEARKKDRTAVQNKDTCLALCIFTYMRVCVCVCVERVRKKQGGGGHIGGRLMWFSLGPPRGSVLREMPAYWKGEGRRREKGGMRVLLFILTCSTQSLTLESQLRCRGSSAMYTKQWGRAARAHRWWEQRQKIDLAARMCGALLEDQ